MQVFLCFVWYFSLCVIVFKWGVSIFGVGSLKVKLFKKLYLKMLRSFMIISVLFGFIVYVWLILVYECIFIFLWDFCGFIG